MSDDRDQASSRRFGKFRARVVDNEDLLGLGRLLVDLPEVPGAQHDRALPCVPYAGPEVGFHMIPPIGANVWVEFERGDAAAPIWVGCFWHPGEMPAGATGPEQKVIRTATAKLVIDDGDGGGILVDTEPPAAGVTASVRLADESITIAAGEAAVTVNPERGVTISFGGQS